MERIDDQPLLVITAMRILQHAHQEVPGKVDAFGAQSGAPRHFDVDQRQGDRQAFLPIHDFVQAAVARVVILLAIAAEAELTEQVAVHCIDARGNRRVVAGILGDEVKGRVAHQVQAIQVRARIQAWVLEACHQEGRGRQIDTRAVGRLDDQIGERSLGLSQHKGHPGRQG